MTGAPHQDEYARALAVLEQESPRGRLLVACSLLDEVLRRLLLAYFIQGDTARELVEEHGAPLSSYAARARAAYVLGLLSKAELQDVLALGDLRNIFAHQVEVDYEHPEVRAFAPRLRRAAGLAPRDRREPAEVVDAACV
ncbi:MltR family transcriptional regulator, partial [Caulobacter sp. 17J65-9]|uniref:MltR family transcriptional regulator n=1 Tax=Caulobacter sp. 17J65-9 TaxID=2709382 RepID=UPI0013CD5C51